MIVGIPKETYPGERRVALVPASVASLTKAGLEVVVEAGAGEPAGFVDAAYSQQGAKIVTRAVALGADIVLQVRTCGANPEQGRGDLEHLKTGAVVIGFCEPLSSPEAVQEWAAAGCTLFAMELIPRTTRAQSMDALSSMASLAGYKAVLLAGEALPKMFPLMMTAAGTLAPAKVLVMGAGVAGLQAIATARRLGAVVQAYDVRAAVKEQVESLGAKFLVLALDTAAAQGKGGYAGEQSEEFLRKQREMMLQAVAANDVVITTAAVPGKKAPVLVTTEMVTAMQPGSVIVDLAAERGGNCELTRAGETFVSGGVTILGPVNLPATIPFHASQMYSRNISALLLNMVKEGKLNVDTSDEIIRDTLVARDGEVVLAQLRQPAAAAGS